ncbi:MAG TPA: SRPBCC domain-containing protein [Reyranella sp.]|nr:SRPBCC domain-containing protein [Reyranella sp.]
MSKRLVIRQSVVLPAMADRLCAMYLDPAKHAAITGFPVTISRKPGSLFKAFNGALSGRVLAVEAPHLIVQSWRSTSFDDDDPYSTLILSFRPAGKARGRIDLVHLDVPKGDYKGVSEGWPAYYWKPWRRYLAR